MPVGKVNRGALSPSDSCGKSNNANCRVSGNSFLRTPDDQGSGRLRGSCQSIRTALSTVANGTGMSRNNRYPETAGLLQSSMKWNRYVIAHMEE